MRIVSMRYEYSDNRGCKLTKELYGDVLNKYNARITGDNACEIDIPTLETLLNLEKDLDTFHKAHRTERWELSDYWGLMIVTDDDGEQYLLIKDEYD